jgi:DNA repair exonuclease SbcCD ATPase subunit
MFKLTASNVFSFHKLEFDFRNRGLVLLQGVNRDSTSAKSNGAGKSACLDTLCWVLYGECLRLKDYDKIVNNSVGSDAEGIVEWDTYKVVRYRRHKKFKNDVHFFDYSSDKPEQTAKSNADTQKLIDRAIGLTYESFIKAIYFQQNTVTSFAKAKDSEQKTIIEDILGLNLLSDAQESCKQTVKSYLVDLDEKEKQLGITRMRIEDVEKKISETVKRRQFWQTQHESEIDSLVTKIKTLTQQSIEKPAPFDFDMARSAIESAELIGKEVEVINDHILNLTNRKAEQISNRRIVQNNLENLKQQQLKNIEARDSFKNAKVPKCPTCGSEMGTAKAEQHLNELNSKIEQLKTSIPIQSLR